ncbi:MAG: resolvase [Cyanobacteria bacterium J06638_22]
MQDRAVPDPSHMNGGLTNGVNPTISTPSHGIPMSTNDTDMTVATNSQGYMDIEAVQKVLNRSRASVYRYANTDPDVLDAEWNPKRLNPEKREHKDDPLKFHPSEVARFAREVLGIKNVRIEQREPEETVTQSLLRQILVELQHIRKALEEQPPR